jgi:predicted transcriptional regulator
VHGENTNLDILEDSVSLNILYVLIQSQERRMIRGVLYSRISSSSNTAQKRIDSLIRHGLIAETIEPLPPKRKWVELTEKGRLIAEKLVEIEEILGS